MKILYFHQYFSTPLGAAGTRSYEMAKRLVAKGHEVTIICGSSKTGNTGINTQFKFGKRVGYAEGIRIIEWNLAYSNHDPIYKRVITFLKYSIFSSLLVFTINYDLVLASSTPLTAAIPGILARWIKRKKFIFEVRDLWPELPKALGMRNPLLLGCMAALEKSAYLSAQSLIGLAPGIVDGIRKQVPHKPIAMIPNGSDFKVFDSIKKKGRPCGVSESDLFVIYAGTHGVANGLEAVIQVAIELEKRKRKDIKMVLVGSGKTKSFLIKEVNQWNLKQVLFLDPLPKTELASLFAGADLGLQILSDIPEFYYGTSPNKFFDYIAAGLPVLNNYPGWLSNIIRQHRCGYAVKANDAILFANALEHAADNRDQLKEMGIRARLLAESEFSREKLGGEFVNWIEASV